MSDRPKSHQIPLELPEYVDAWASDLLRAVGKREARRIRDDYKALAENKRLAKQDRDIAAERARALEEIL